MNKVFIIAEAGVNHNGNLQLAKELIEIAKAAGADAVKFQTFKAANVVTKFAEKAEYQKNNVEKLETQYEMIKKLELSYHEQIELVKYCNLLKIEFMSTPFDLESVEFLSKLRLKRIKIPSGEVTNLIYLKKIASLGIETIMSTGMCNLFDIEIALDILLKNGLKKEQITILHCNTQYPTPYEDVNLNAMLTIGKSFNVRYGYSDHTLGSEVSVAAVALGATIIEKHFTKSKDLFGPDHKASMEPDELIRMINKIRNIEIALGSFEKNVTKSEIKNIIIARKSIHIKKNMKVGDIIHLENLVFKRPGNGISPMKMDDVIGKKINSSLLKDHLLSWEDLH